MNGGGWLRLGGWLAGLLIAGAPAADAQGFRLRIDTRAETVRYRGLTADSIRSGQVVTGTNGGRETPEGYPVFCQPGRAFCSFYRPGPILNGGPFVTSANLVIWGLGLPGLSLHGDARIGVDMGDSRVWPGTEPAFQLFEGYLDYTSRRITARAGRLIENNRLGYNGFDGGRVAVRIPEALNLELTAYGGGGLARGAALPVTNPVLNPLDEFQPRRRFVTAGAAASIATTPVDARLDYLREVDPDVRYFVSEQVAGSVTVRPHERFTLTGGAIYDLAQGLWGSADLSLRYTTPRVTLIAGARQYRPRFDLWTIWGAFSPVAYRAVNANVAVNATARLQLRARGEYYKFDDAEVTTGLVAVEDHGYRASGGVSYVFSPEWNADLGYQREFGTGAASQGWEGSVTWTPTERLSLTAQGASLQRPLEFRFSESALYWYGLDVRYQASDRVRFGLDAAVYDEDRRRPDAAAVDWRQVRVAGRVTLLFSTNADGAPLPPAARRRPAGR
ncbi:MAG: hypothetical protein ACOY71_09920 [Gemmatimonadota bacterium]